MPATLIVPPGAEPVSLAEVKASLRLTDAAEDALAAAMIATARSHVEAVTRRQLVTQTWRVTLDAWPRDGVVELGLAPVRRLIAVEVTDASGGVIALQAELFHIDRARLPGRLRAPPGLRAPGRASAGIAIDVEVGHGTPAEVPAPLREAILRLAGAFITERGPTEGRPIPDIVEALIAPYRVLSP